MAYRYLDHEADVGIRAEGNTLEEAFCEGAKAAFNVMAVLKEVAPNKRVEVHCESKGIDLLFVEWLNELLSLADMEGLFFSEFKIEKIKKEGETYIIDGLAFGERIDAKKHKIKTEVKAATYSGLKYEVIGKRHYLQCVLDL
jgi:SHS2 domain-containing protein